MIYISTIKLYGIDSPYRRFSEELVRLLEITEDVATLSDQDFSGNRISSWMYEQVESNR